MNAPLRNSSFDSAGLQFAWDSTSIGLAEECLRKYQYRIIEGWVPRGTGVHLRFGGHYATAIEHYHKQRALQGASHEEALLTVIDEALFATWEHPRCEACEGRGFNQIDPKTLKGHTANIDWIKEDCEACGARGFLEGGTPWTSDHPVKTRENLLRTIVWYLESFKEDALDPIILGNGKPAVELSFSFEVDGGLMFAGHLDRLALYSGDPYVVDQKTTGSTVSPRFFEGFSPDTQMSMYTFAGKVVFDVPVRGVVIDAAQIAVGFSRFVRGFTFRSQDQLDEWYEDTLYHIEKAREATREAHFPMNRKSCGNYGGCEFRNVCSKSPSVREQFLKGDFTKQTWDPLQRR